jgi:hypothetical protein
MEPGVALPGGIYTVQLDPEVEQGRPYAYANAFEFGATELFVVDVLTDAVIGTYSRLIRRVPALRRAV